MNLDDLGRRLLNWQGSVLAALAALAAPAMSLAAVGGAPVATWAVPWRVLAGTSAGPANADLAALLAASGARVERRIGTLPLRVMKVAGVTVAVLDSELDLDLPDLASALVPGWNFVDNTSNDADLHGHGTKVAGTVSAVANNGIGLAGVAGGSKIMPVRVADWNGWAALSASGMTWAADCGARVANISKR